MVLFIASPLWWMDRLSRTTWFCLQTNSGAVTNDRAEGRQLGDFRLMEWSKQNCQKWLEILNVVVFLFRLLFIKNNIYSHTYKIYLNILYRFIFGEMRRKIWCGVCCSCCVVVDIRSRWRKFLKDSRYSKKFGFDFKFFLGGGLIFSMLWR